MSNINSDAKSMFSLCWDVFWKSALIPLVRFSKCIFLYLDEGMTFFCLLLPQNLGFVTGSDNL